MENKSTEPPIKRNTTKVLLVSGGIIVFLLIGSAFLLFLACLGVSYPIQILFDTFLGWYSFITRVIPLMSVSVNDVMTALILSVSIAVVIQLLGSYFIRHFHKQNRDSVPDHWRIRWTFAVMVLLVISFAGGFAVVGVAHQSARLVGGDEDFLRRGRSAMRRSTSKNNLKQIGLAMHNYHDLHSRLPIGGTFRAGEPHHSWVTRLLPYLDQKPLYDKIDFHQPWTAKINRQHFQSDLYIIQNPGLKSNYDNGKSSEEAFQGYQPSHYAANSRVLNVNGGMNFKEITDGTSNTILAGEIRSNIKPWGDPTNFRDPARGINQSPHGFGGPFKGGANILLGDGSVRFISEEIDPTVLKALSTPDGNETVGDF